MSLKDQQIEICKKYNVTFQSCDLSLKVGVSRSLESGRKPIHGMRVKEENGTSGWYIWEGEFSDSSDFFVPLHGEHLKNWAEIVLKYLGLPEGWRFLVGDNYEDCWKDEALHK
jgi:hypothetical protein